MPAILKREQWDAWLDGDVRAAKALIQPYDGPTDAQITTPQLSDGSALDIVV